MRRRHLAMMAVAAIAAAWFAFLGPRQLGGPVTYVVTSGSSMEPKIRTGDLVLARTRAKYDVGDVVAYDSPDVNKTILHRIVAVDGDRFVLQGDANNWLDNHRPSTADIYGEKWVRIPSAGKLVEWLRSPMVVLVLVGLIMAGVLGAREKGSSRRRARARPASGGMAKGSRATTAPASLTPVSPAAGGRTAPTAAASVALVGFLVFGWSWTVPTTRPVMREASFWQEGEFSYTAPVPAGPVYEKGEVETGEPVFLQVTGGVDVEFRYRLVSEVPADVDGTGELALEVSNQYGWRRVIPLQPKTAFEGKTATLGGRLDAQALRGLVTEVEAATGAAPGVYRVAVTADVSVKGTIGGQHADERFKSTLPFKLDDLMLRVDEEATAKTKKPFEPSKEGSVDVPARVANRLTLPLLRPSVGAVRLGSLALGVGALALGIALAVAASPRRRMSEREWIKAKYGYLLLPVDGAEVRSDQAVRVSTFKGLAEIAERFEVPVLVQEEPTRSVYAAREGLIWYVYESIEPTDGPVSPEPEPPTPPVEEEPPVAEEAPSDPVAEETPAPVEPPRLPAEEEQRVRDAAHMGRSRWEVMNARATVEGMLRALGKHSDDDQGERGA